MKLIIIIYQQSASGEYRDVISGLNNKMALKFSPLGVDENYLLKLPVN
jgi:hypothetical protein